MAITTQQEQQQEQLLHGYYTGNLCRLENPQLRTKGFDFSKQSITAHNNM